MAAELARLQSEIESHVSDYNQLDKKAQQLVQTRNSLHEQESENSLVLKEMELLSPGTLASSQTPRSSSRWAVCSSSRTRRRRGLP